MAGVVLSTRVSFRVRAVVEALSAATGVSPSEWLRQKIDVAVREETRRLGEEEQGRSLQAEVQGDGGSTA